MLVGRDDELALLVSAVSEPPAVLAVEGEAGIGKTRLVSELPTRPELADRRHAAGSCRRIQEPLPLGVVLEAVRGLGRHLVNASLSPVVGVLRPLVPEMADQLPPELPQLDDRDAERHRVFRGLVELLDSLGQVVLVLEDLHWTDGHTRDFLSYLLADPPRGLSLVLTFRGEEIDPGMRALTATPPAWLSRAHVELRPLDPSQTGALAAAILGTDRLAGEFTRYLCERASGLPLAIEELLALLQARGSLIRLGDGWARRTLDSLDVPVGIRDQVLERFNRLPPDARQVVEAAAVLQTPVPVRVLVASCRLTTARAVRGLEDAIESGMLTDDGEVVGFRHVLAAQAVYERVPGQRRQHLHGRAASALDSMRPVPLGQIAHHLRHAGRWDAWVEVAERAADKAVDLGHDDAAVQLLEDVLRGAPLRPEQRGRLAVKMGRAALETLHARPVAGLLREILQQDLPRVARSELRALLGLALVHAGEDPLEWRHLFAGAVDDLDDRPDLKAWVMLALGLPGTPDVPLAEHLTWLERSLEVVPEVGRPAFELFVLGKVAMVRVAIGDPSWRDLTDRILQGTGGSPQRRDEVNACYSVGVEACHVGHYELAGRLLAAGSRGAAACGSRRLDLSIRSATALLRYYTGSWEGLRERVEVLVDELAHYPHPRFDAELVAGSLALAHGDLDVAEQRLASVLDHAGRLAPVLLLQAAGTATRLALASGEVDSAVTRVHGLLPAVERERLWAPLARALPAVVQAMTTAGQRAAARTLVRRTALALGDLDAPLATAALRHARGFLGAAVERWDAASAHFTAAAQLYDRLRCPYEAAQAREEAAGVQFAAGNDPAGGLLRASLITYRELGATRDAGRAARTARERGVSLPAHNRGGQLRYGGSLSPRERQVAVLASRGHSNKDIASQLFLSVNTIQRHMTSAMRKLGVRSRAALAHQLVSIQPGDLRPPD